MRGRLSPLLCLLCLLGPAAPRAAPALGALLPPTRPAAELGPSALRAPPPTPRLGARLLIGAGAAMMVTGLIGLLASPHCHTRAADRRCVDPRGSHPAFPALVVVGLGAATTGAWWYRQDAPQD